MRYLALYTAIIALTAISCSTNRSFTMEDDIYYIPGEKALMVKEVENLTGQEISSSIQTDTYPEEVSHAKGSSIAPAAFTQSKQQVINSQTGKLENVDMAALTTQAENMLANNEKVNATIYENTGYWVGGFKGSENDLEEIQRIINLYPEGFASFNTNGYDIAMNLSFDPDWNVYTDNGRLWWFPSNSNIELYSSLLFGTYPKYIWTVIWDNPRFDSYAFNASFNHRGNWGFRFGWGSGGWHAGFGWNSGWYDPWYDPWYNWYGWYDPWNGPWCNPWYGYYPGWYNPHWHHHWDHPGWGGGGHGSGNRPRPITGLRPSYSGGGTAGSIRPNRPSGGNTNAGSVRPGNIRPNTSASARPNSGTVTRPGTSSSTRPNGTVTRPGNNSTIRPGTSVTRPGNNTTRPNGTVTRPGTTTRPTTVTRPGTTTRPSSGITRPGSNRQSYTRPVSTTRPGTSVTRPSNISRPNTSQYSRPASRTSSSGNVKSYSRPQSSYRPTYNNNSSSGYTPSRSSGSSGGGGSYIPSRNSGGSSGGGGGGAVHRPTRR